MEYVEIIKNTQAEEKQFAKSGWGHEFLLISDEQLKKVATGEFAIAVFDGEYTHVIALKKPIAQ